MSCQRGQRALGPLPAEMLTVCKEKGGKEEQGKRLASGAAGRWLLKKKPKIKASCVAGETHWNVILKSFSD